MTEPTPQSTRRWRGVFLIGVLAGLLAFAQLAPVQRLLGISDFGLWFLDSYAVLAASDTVRAGGDPDRSMPLDFLHRSHHYSDWWYGLRYLGLTRADNFYVGGAWILGFVAAAFLLLRPTGPAQTAWYLSLTLSPPVLLAFMRANNDLVVFVLLVAAALALGRWSVSRLVFALAMVALAAGLKYYPLVAGAVFLLVRPKSRLTATVLGSAAVLVAVLANVAPTLVKRGYFFMPKSIGTFGAGMIFQDTRLNPYQILMLGTVLLSVAALALVRAGWLQKTDPGEPDPWQEERAAFVLGAVVLVACFLAGLSFNYRCIFCLLLAPWLWRRAPGNAAAKAALWLTTALLWLDGLYYAAINLLAGFGSVSGEWEDPITHVWMLGTQVATWVLMALLTGWLLEVFLAAWRIWRAPATDPVQAG